jgi:hypothetical protein
VLGIAGAVSANGGSDYFVYSHLDTGVVGSYGVDGYVGSDGVDRIVFYSGSTAFIYTVTIPEGADPNMHPDNPEAPGPVAPRTFSLEMVFPLGVFPGHECEFWVDSEADVMYLGATVGILKYVYDEVAGTYVYDSAIAPPAPMQENYGTQTLAYDPTNDVWYAGSVAWNHIPGVTQRDMWKYDGSQGPLGVWELAFKYTTPEGTHEMCHHDGLEFVNGYLWLADHTGDYVKQYETNGTLVEVFWRQPLGHELEGMGFGALGHFWCGSHFSTISEFGGGPLQQAVEEVEIDIKPGSFPNSINTKSKGVIPVAILTTDHFEADTVNPDTVRFGPAEAEPVHWALEDVDGDGDIDMVLHFRTRDTGIGHGDVEAELIGETWDGIPIRGLDSVRTVPAKG